MLDENFWNGNFFLKEKKSFFTPALYVVSVPIGNLEDITLRALRVLSNADKIYCEDTRVTAKLLNLYNIRCPTLIRCDSYKEQSLSNPIINDIREGKIVVLVSDAGTPLISDPGYVIVKSLREENIPIIPVTGISALTAALSSSGLPTDKFVFLGFPPKKSQAQKQFLQEHLLFSATYAFYERGERVLELLRNIAFIHPEAKIVIAREITKKFEEFLSMDIRDCEDNLKERDLKGEVVCLVWIPEKAPQEVSEETLEDEIMQLLISGGHSKEITQIITEKYNLPKKHIYNLVQNVKNKVS